MPRLLLKAAYGFGITLGFRVTEFAFANQRFANLTALSSHRAETENESAILQEEDEEEEEEEKYIIPAEIAPVLDAQPVNSANDSQSNTTETDSPPPTQSAGESDLEMCVLRRQEQVLQLQEEYYSLKIKYLKDKMAKDSGQND